VHVVFAFAGSTLICAGEMGKEMRPQIEEEEMPGCFFAHRAAAVEPLRVVDGGGMVVFVGDAMAEVAGLGGRECFEGGLEQRVKDW